MVAVVLVEEWSAAEGLDAGHNRGVTDEGRGGRPHRAPEDDAASQTTLWSVVDAR